MSDHAPNDDFARRFIAASEALRNISTAKLEAIAAETTALRRNVALRDAAEEAAAGAAWAAAKAAGARAGRDALREHWDKAVAEDVTGDGRGHTALRGQLDALIEAAWDEETAEPPSMNHITGSEPPC